MNAVIYQNTGKGQITDNMSQNMFKTNCLVFLKIFQYYPHCSIAFSMKLDLRNAGLS